MSDEVIEKLKPVEWQSLQEAALCSGSGSYVASEFMATRALESLSKRLTKERTWADAIGELEDEYEELTGAIEYLKNERNQVAHPDKEESSRIEARQTYDMVIRMVEEILNPDEKYKN